MVLIFYLPQLNCLACTPGLLVQLWASEFINLAKHPSVVEDQSSWLYFKAAHYSALNLILWVVVAQWPKGKTRLAIILNDLSLTYVWLV